ncbi:unnamed protein product [Hydatigera taeniaeformis]|uniref:Dynein light chain roadblock-type 1 n=1 Tax=Hydatigena taeniaeformis TaxID=6205 RepID=A0A0R3XC56_HYDTA|nr:unnamed protein product [Hydatigera taeniaeformis]
MHDVVWNSMIFQLQDFQEYMQKNPIENSLLFSLIGLSSQSQTTRGISSVGHGEEECHRARALTMPARERLGPSFNVLTSMPVVTTSGRGEVTFCELQRASQVFLRYQTEVAVQAVRRTAQAMQSLASRLALSPANAWHECAAFGTAVKRVLKNRHGIQASGDLRLEVLRLGL